MKKYVNGKYVELTAEEITAMQSEQRRYKLQEQSRPFTAEEVNRMLITKQVNTLTVDDNTALRMMEFYPTFESIVGQTVKKGYKFTYGGKLWSVVQPELTVQSHYAPGAGMESLYTEVCETHSGTMEDPVPYDGNMVLTAGKYYAQNDIIYLCTRDTGNPVYHPLAELVGLYVKEI